MGVEVEMLDQQIIDVLVDEDGGKLAEAVVGSGGRLADAACVGGGLSGAADGGGG